MAAVTIGAMMLGGAVAGKPALPWDPTPSPDAAYARAAAITALGQALFNEPALSASGKMSCASCHDPAHGFSAPNSLPVQLGGPHLDQFGTRAVPGLTYAASTPPFSEHFFESEDEGDESVDQGPTGGRDWDGRVDRARDQARLPLLDPAEMANPDPASVVAAVSRSAEAKAIRSLYGPDVFADPGRAFVVIGEALEFYQQANATFSPFSSKYDFYQRGQATLTAQEQRGLGLFNDPAKGNCAECHKSAVTADGQPPLFSDAGYVALGLPRNIAIPANTAADYFDLGLCGPLRSDLAAHKDYCGMFKAPSLRNVALKQSFYHNGLTHSLRDAVAFYVERDTKPEKWYPHAADGTVLKFNDLPSAYRGNVSMEQPFGGKPGDPPALSAQEVDDVVAFLHTLTDGYKPSDPAAPADGSN